MRTILFAILITVTIYYFWINAGNGKNQTREQLQISQSLTEQRQTQPILVVTDDRISKSQLKLAKKEMITDETLTQQEDFRDSDSEGHVRNEPVCRARPENEVTKKDDVIVYRWTDENGRVQFSDRITPEANKIKSKGVETYNIDIGQMDYFDITVDVKGTRAPPFLKSQLIADVTKIYRVLAIMIGESRLRKSSLNIIIFDNKRNYEIYRNEDSPGVGNAAGYYKPKENRAVTYRRSNHKRTRQVSRHESTHIIAREMFGKTPVWFSEGLAEYFEKMTVENVTGTVKPQKKRFNTVKNLISIENISLSKFVDKKHSSFHKENSSINYSIAWSLIYYLFSQEEGRQFLGHYMQFMSDNYCVTHSSAEIINKYYLGGMNAMETGWKHWLSYAQLKEHVWRH